MISNNVVQRFCPGNTQPKTFGRAISSPYLQRLSSFMSKSNESEKFEKKFM